LWEVNISAELVYLKVFDELREVQFHYAKTAKKKKKKELGQLPKKVVAKSRKGGDQIGTPPQNMSPHIQVLLVRIAMISLHRGTSALCGYSFYRDSQAWPMRILGQFK